MARKVIRAEGVEIHADKIRKGEVNMQTGNHEGQNRKVEKDVTIEVTAPSSKSGTSESHPGKGRIYKAGKADVDAKRVLGPWPSSRYGQRQKRIIAKQDVTVGFDESKGREPRSRRSR